MAEHEEIHHSHFIAISMGVLVVAALLGMVMVRLQQNQIAEAKAKKSA